MSYECALCEKEVRAVALEYDGDLRCPVCGVLKEASESWAEEVAKADGETEEGSA